MALLDKLLKALGTVKLESVPAAPRKLKPNLIPNRADMRAIGVGVKLPRLYGDQTWRGIITRKERMRMMQRAGATIR